MTPWFGARRIRSSLSLILVASVAGAFCASTVMAQRESLPVDLPNGPAKDGFDISRFTNLGNGWFETFYVEDTEPLAEVLQQGRVANDTMVLVFETADGPMSLINDQMAFHHIAEGRAGDKDWMATF